MLHYLEKRDLTFLEEYISATTSTGTPKYYAMLDTGATGESGVFSTAEDVAPTGAVTGETLYRHAVYKPRTRSD